MKKIFKDGPFTGGFTLVELLIVIGLLGAIALIVIAAINPIEQANRARDTRFKSDAAQMISAIDRYFASQHEFPWQTITPTYTPEDTFGFVSASNEEVGVCGTDCTTDDGVLISGTNELKTEFRNRDFIQDGGLGATLDEQIIIGKGAGATESIYACYIPLSKSVRQKAVNDGVVYTPNASGDRGSAVATCDDPTVNWIESSCYVCIPE